MVISNFKELILRVTNRPVGVVATVAVISMALATMARGTDGETVLSDMDCVVEPSLVVNLGSAVPGLIQDTYFDVGDYVSAGARVAQLEDAVERLSLSIAEARAADSSALQLRELASDLGKRTRERNSTLNEDTAISAQALDQLETEAAVAELQVVQEARAMALAEIEAKRAKALLDQRSIKSPIDGSVVNRYASSGEYVDGEPVFKIAQLDPLHVEVIVPIEYLDTLTAGMQAGVVLEAPGFAHRSLEAHIARIDAVADAASATYGVRLVIDNPELNIPSGVRCSVDFFSS